MSPAPGSRGRRDGQRHVVSQRVPHTEAAEHGEGSGQEGNGCRGYVAPDVAAAEEPGTHEVSAEYDLLLRPSPYMWLAHQVFTLHVLRSCASSIFTCFSFMSFLKKSLSSGLPIFQCPPTSMFSLLHLRQSFSPSCPNHLSLTSLIFSLMFATPALAFISSFMIFSILFIPIIHLNIFISVLSSKFGQPFSVSRSHFSPLC